jgi:hypothetical protein
MKSGQITEHFAIADFALSSRYPDLASKIVITPQDELKLFFLCSTILEPVHDVYGDLVASSGKRALGVMGDSEYSHELNTKVGGSPTSDHLYEYLSCAWDFGVMRGSIKDVFVWISVNLPHSFGQLIYYPKKDIVHVSLPTPKHRGEQWVEE